jgi:hypothetical protein
VHAGVGMLAPAEFTRRHVLRLMVATAGSTLLHWPGGAKAASLPLPAAPHGFLTAEELATLDAATARIIPTDGQPGARECGVVHYIQSMLSFMPGSDANCDRRVNAADLTAMAMRLAGPRSGCPSSGDVNGNGVVDTADIALAESAVFQAQPVFAGGPFSGRQPQPHIPAGSRACERCHLAPLPQESGGAGAALPTLDYYPPNYFTQFLPLPRLRALSWKIRILGAAAVPEVAGNPLATTSLEADLRNKYRVHLAELDSVSQQQYQKPFVQLSPDEQDKVLALANQDFVTLLTYHTLEGMFCAPEYGGNRERLGWQLIRFDGDSQPLGYTIYDESAPGNYRERPDKPNSDPNPDEDCAGFSAKVNRFLTVISRADFVQPGAAFRTPYCFNVPSQPSQLPTLDSLDE